MHRILPTLSDYLPSEPGPAIRIAHRRHKTIFAYDDQFRPFAPLYGHYWAIVPLRRRSGRNRSRATLQLSDFIPIHIPRAVRRRSHESQGGSGPDCRPSPETGEDQPLDAEAQHLAQDSPPDVDLMIPDHNAPPSYSIEGSRVMAHIDPQLAMAILQQVELPPICVNWGLGYRFLIHQFQPEFLFRSRIATVHGNFYT